jgi:hypothetical protein
VKLYRRGAEAQSGGTQKMKSIPQWYRAAAIMLGLFILAFAIGNYYALGIVYPNRPNPITAKWILVPAAVALLLFAEAVVGIGFRVFERRKGKRHQ